MAGSVVLFTHCQAVQLSAMSKFNFLSFCLIISKFLYQKDIWLFPVILHTSFSRKMVFCGKSLGGRLILRYHDSLLKQCIPKLPFLMRKEHTLSTCCSRCSLMVATFCRTVEISTWTWKRDSLDIRNQCVPATLFILPWFRVYT